MVQVQVTRKSSKLPKPSLSLNTNLKAKTSLKLDIASKPSAKVKLLSKVDTTPLYDFLQDSQPVEIIPGLYLGNQDHATNLKLLQQLNINSVLNVAKEVDYSYPESFRTLHFRWSHNQQKIEDDFLKAFEFIELGRSNPNHNVLVHCAEGISRSASMIIAYLIFKFNFTSDQAYAFLQNQSPKISPNLNLMCQLAAYAKVVHNNITV